MGEKKIQILQNLWSKALWSIFHWEKSITILKMVSKSIFLTLKWLKNGPKVHIFNLKKNGFKPCVMFTASMRWKISSDQTYSSPRNDIRSRHNDWPLKGPPLSPLMRQCCDDPSGFRGVFNWAFLEPRDAASFGQLKKFIFQFEITILFLNLRLTFYS